MGSYSIKELELYSGVRAHTIRMWEKRYKLLQPERTDTNIRSYSVTQLKKLLKIASLKEAGHRPCEISQMSTECLNREVSQLQYDFIDPNHTAQINVLITEMFNYNESGVNRLLSSCILKLGIEKTVLEIINPFMARIGLLWSTSEIHPGHEHFISHLIRQKILSATESLTIKKEKSKRFLLFLPPGEFHDMPLLLANYILREKGHEVLYLGQSTPLDAIKLTHETWKADYFLSANPSRKCNCNCPIPQWLKSLAKEHTETKILFAGQLLENGVEDINVSFLLSFSDLLEYV